MGEIQTDTSSTPDTKRTHHVVRWDLLVASLATIFAAFAAVAGFWSANEAHQATKIAADTAALETKAALIQSCGEASPSLFRIGDDFVILTGAGGDNEYWNSVEPEAFNKHRPQKTRVFLRCQYSNFSRVPLLSIYVHYRIGYHHNKTIKQEHSFPFPLAPNATNAIWFFNIETPTVVVPTPERARYATFPDLGTLESHALLPRVRDYWILYRDHDPDEHLDESMM